MKREDENVDEVLGKVLHSTPQQEMEAAGARVLQRLRTDTGDLAEADAPVRRQARWVWGLAVAAAAVVAVMLWSGGSRTFVEAAGGGLYRTSGETIQAVAAGETIEIGDTLRTKGGANASIALADGSRMEIRAHTEFSIQRADDGMRIHLIRGGVIVSAAKRRTGHLYVQTQDVTVSVVGTVFSVSAEEEGSHVSVIEGEVRVQQGTTTKNLLPGEELSTSRKAETQVIRLQQSAPSTPAVTRPLRFEAASLKLEPPARRPIATGPALECRGTDGSLLRAPESLGAGLGRCVARRVSLTSLISAVYGLEELDWFNTMRAGNTPPDWADDPYEHGFQLDAKAENPATTTKADLQEMLQTMLAERFKLKLTWQTGEADGYTLSLAKSGLKIREAPSEEALTITRLQTETTITRVISGKASIKALAEFMTGVGRIFLLARVSDATGLTGIYDIKLSFDVPRVNRGPGGAGGPRGGGAPAGDGQSSGDEALKEALQQQLGLQLNEGKIPTRLVVIDHAEMPTEN